MSAARARLSIEENLKLVELDNKYEPETREYVCSAQGELTNERPQTDVDGDRQDLVILWRTSTQDVPRPLPGYPRAGSVAAG